jgi:hypothetical protein
MQVRAVDDNRFRVLVSGHREDPTFTDANKPITYSYWHSGEIASKSLERVPALLPAKLNQSKVIATGYPEAYRLIVNPTPSFPHVFSGNPGKLHKLNK